MIKCIQVLPMTTTTFPNLFIQEAELLSWVCAEAYRLESGPGMTVSSTFKTNNHLLETSGLGRKSDLPVIFRTCSRNVSNVE